MSWITDAVVLMGCEDEQVRLAEVNEKLALLDEGRRQAFGAADNSDMDWAGGSKFFVGTIWAGAFNHINPEWLTEALACANWRHPEHVILLVQDEGEYEWSIIRPAKLSDRTDS